MGTGNNADRKCKMGVAPTVKSNRGGIEWQSNERDLNYSSLIDHQAHQCRSSLIPDTQFRHATADTDLLELSHLSSKRSTCGATQTPLKIIS